MSNALIQSQLNSLKLLQRGKVRDIYDLGKELLMVATDRISAFDFVLSPGIPGKGVMLTQISRFWMEKFAHLVPNHLTHRSLAEVIPDPAERKVLEGRSEIVKKTKPLPVEFIVRGYLVGSGYKDYLQSGEVCGIKLPSGLKEASKLPEPLLTPSTKAEIGEHDENISLSQMEEILGKEIAGQAGQICLKLYQEAAAYALERGIIIADTKFELGLLGDEIILIDEALTPDSSRFWPLESYQEGKNPPSFDKQFVRDYLNST
ncbi:MAG: phosphoribosylaminoimidazolesuccinocarboxamide synthase, partial [Deltaproteobacteria bacterium]|nr:phosphoribosylaminoimidazolesuccinocarboxamide synthase [Deltaproteobacteria bacterium]